MAHRVTSSRDTIAVCKMQTQIEFMQTKMAQSTLQRAGNFALSLSLTTGGTKAETSPPIEAI